MTFHYVNEDSVAVYGWSAHYLLKLIEKSWRSGGIDRLSEEQQRTSADMARALRRAATAWERRVNESAGHADVPVPADAALSDYVTAEQAALMLDLTDRQVRRMAPDLGGEKRTAGRWMIPALSVVAERDRRNGAAT